MADTRDDANVAGTRLGGNRFAAAGFSVGFGVDFVAASMIVFFTVVVVVVAIVVISFQ
jgi:hypothetical protein